MNFKIHNFTHKRKKFFLEEIHELHANALTLRKFAHDKYVDESGKAVVKVYVKNDELYNPLSNPNKPDLKQEIFDYIENEIHYIPIEYPLKIVLVAEEKIDDLGYVEQSIRDHYWKRVADIDDDLKRNSIVSLLLFILGIVFLAIYLILEFVSQQQLFNEIFSIVGSFAVWESIDYFLLQRGILRADYYNMSQIALAEVTSMSFKEDIKNSK